MDNRSFTHQIYHLKAVCNQSEKEHSITFEGDLIMSLDGFFEGIVEESLSSDESRKCYVAGEIYDEKGITLTKLAPYGKMRMTYFLGMVMDPTQSVLALDGEWNYCKELMRITEYDPKLDKIVYDSAFEKEYTYGGVFHFSLEKQDAYQRDVRNRLQGIYQFTEKFSSDLKEIRNHIFSPYASKKKRDAFFSMYHNYLEEQKQILETLKDEIQVKVYRR